MRSEPKKTSTMMNRFTLLLSLLTVADAFHGLASRRTFRRQVAFLKSTKEDPMTSSKPVDMTRAHDCAEHFGRCSVNEIEELKDNLHNQRMQRFLLSDEEKQPRAPIDDSLEHHVLEEELDLQLAMLKHEESKAGLSILFPEVEEPMDELPHLKDNTVSKHNADVVHKAEESLAMAETVLEENVLETIAVCGAIVLVWFAPHFPDVLNMM
jgi:hypothetical protein